jgi:hypothetical protein
VFAVRVYTLYALQRSYVRGLYGMIGDRYTDNLPDRSFYLSGRLVEFDYLCIAIPVNPMYALLIVNAIRYAPVTNPRCCFVLSYYPSLSESE